MKNHRLVTHFNVALKWIFGTTSVVFAFAVSSQAVPWPDRPLSATETAAPLTMLIAGRDHKLFHEAYNDASDIGGGPNNEPDGILDIRFNPKITYFGLYDSALCYSYSGDNSRELAGNSGLFTPAATAAALGKCTGSSAPWSGNWLNYVTTSRIDALRKVLYGGYREVDKTTETILRRAYIPQDAHSWGKEYTSENVDKYKISDYTPLAQPISGQRHLFGSLTHNAGQNCNLLTKKDCSSLPPLLSVAANSSKRVWDWASAEVGQILRHDLSGGTVTQYTVRVKVCVAPNFLNDCKEYKNGGYKPVGLLHEYGENSSMLFGLITGSYDQSRSGGLLRKNVASFEDEVDPDTGLFRYPTADAKQPSIVKTFDKLRIQGFNRTDENNQYANSNDWDNPIAEMLYEGVRYFAGKATPTTRFGHNNTNSLDVSVFGNKNIATWEDPYAPNSNAKAPWCARASTLTISDINTSFDSDELPGVFSSFDQQSMSPNDLAGLNVLTEATTITGVESSVTGAKFIGQSGSTASDGAPTAKLVTNLGQVRGISPEEPTRQGAYYAASVAHFAKKTDLRPDLPGSGVMLSNPDDPRKKNTVDMFKVALASPLPVIAAKLPNGDTITVVPFGKTVTFYDGQTMSILDYYVLEHSDPGEPFYAKFRISFSDSESGNDHDMDVVAEYTVKANANNTVTVTVSSPYEFAGAVMNFGYVLSGAKNGADGSKTDGVYLVAQNDPHSESYFLNTPRVMNPVTGLRDTWLKPGACNVTTNLPASCSLPLAVSSIHNGGTARTAGGNTYFSDVRTFEPSGTAGATFLKDPLWYAAKWGGLQEGPSKDENGNIRPNVNDKPDTVSEWDSNGDSVPDTYFLVQNPLKLKQALGEAFNSILARTGGGGNVIANSRVLSTSTSSETLIFQGVFDTQRWSGNLIAYKATAANGIEDPSWNAAAKMPSPASRKIFYSTGSGAGGELPVSGPAPAALATHIDSASLLRFLRGDHTQEKAQGGAFRDRATTFVIGDKAPVSLGTAARLGDISHSAPVYVKDTSSVYVGANDGMLHAFDAITGVEQFAFIPSAVLPRLKNLAVSSYNDKHEFFVDGDIAVSSRTQTAGKNHLVAALGRGGKGLFGLEVTNAGATPGFNTSDVEWEYFDATDADLGFMLGRPIITKMNDGNWVVLIGNGYESTSGLAALYIFKLDDGTLLRKITMNSAGTGNGMATPGVYDQDGNGTADTVYAGDLKGNLWKFDVSATSAINWALGNGGLPIYRARNKSDQPQPITAPVTVAKNTVVGDPNKDKVHVFFGTGSYFRSTDPKDKSVQSWYSVIDRTPVSPAASVSLSRSQMSEGSIKNVGIFEGKPVRTFTDVPVAPSLGATDGCFIDFIDTPASGERMVTASNLQRLAEPTLIGSSIIPVVDQCEPGGTGYINAINPFTCARLSKPFFDVNNKEGFSDDLLKGDFIGSLNLGVGMPGEAIIVGNRLILGGSEGTLGSVVINSGSLRPKGRISWREIVRD